MQLGESVYAFVIQQITKVDACIPLIIPIFKNKFTILTNKPKNKKIFIEEDEFMQN